MTPTIRLATPDDAAPLAALASRTFQDTFGQYNTPEDMAIHVSQAYGEEKQRAELTDPAMTVLVVEHDGRLAGFAMLRDAPAPDCIRGERPIELWRFYLGRELHGRGVAQALMLRVQQEAARRGARTLWLGVWERNERAKAFYTKVGFTDVGSHGFLLGNDPQVDRIMVVPLASEPASTMHDGVG